MTTFVLLVLMIPFSILLFVMMMFRNPIQDGTKFYLSATKIPPDNVLERLYKLRTRESEQLKTVVGLDDMEIHQKISMPNCEKLKTVVNRSETSTAKL